MRVKQWFSATSLNQELFSCYSSHFPGVIPNYYFPLFYPVSLQRLFVSLFPSFLWRSCECFPIETLSTKWVRYLRIMQWINASSLSQMLLSSCNGSHFPGAIPNYECPIYVPFLPSFLYFICITALKLKCLVVCHKSVVGY